MSMETLFSWGPGNNVGSLITTTQENRDIKEVQDAVFNRLVLFDHLNSKGKVKTTGGTSIIVPIRQAKNSTAASYSNYGTIDTTPQDELTAAQFKFKQYAASISVSGKEDRVQNKGKYEVMDLVKTKIDGAERSLQDAINTALFATSPSSSQIGSLVTSIDASATIGDINSGTYSFWQSTSTSSGSFSSQGLADMRTTWNTLSKKAPNTTPDLLLTTDSVHSYYEASLQAQQRYMPSNTTGNGSFLDLMFRSAPVKFDAQCTSGAMYFLNSDVMELAIDESTNFVMTPFQQPVNQDAKVALYLVALELVIKNRRKLGKMLSITA